MIKTELHVRLVALASFQPERFQPFSFPFQTFSFQAVSSRLVVTSFQPTISAV